MRWYVSGGKRFYVIDVLGYSINPQAHHPASRAPTRSYAVLDRYNNHKEVASFYSERGRREVTQHEKAVALAERLNRTA